MNLLQALSALPELTAPLGAVYDSVPMAPPRGSYAVVSDITDMATREHFAGQDRRVTVLVSLYGAEQGTLGSLRPLFRQVKCLSGIDRHPGISEPIRHCTLGPVLPPAFDPVTRRPFAGVRYILIYRAYDQVQKEHSHA